MALEKENEAFEKLLPDLLEDHKGKFALIHGDQLVDVYDTFADGMKVGFDKFGVDDPFMVKEVQPPGHAIFLSFSAPVCV